VSIAVGLMLPLTVGGGRAERGFDRPSFAANRSAKAYSRRLRTARELQPRETLLERAQRPTCLDGQGARWLAGLVERYNIAISAGCPSRSSIHRGKALVRQT